MTQLIKFAVVGTFAALLHLCALHFLVQSDWLPPLYANMVAFTVSFAVSYAGQSLWTFNHLRHNHRASLPRFLVTQLLCSFALNQGLYSLLILYSSLSYLVASFLVLVTVPVATFTISKYWAFR